MYCRECFGDYCISKISEAQVDRESLVCPATECKTPITPHELKANVSAETYARFERFTLRQLCKDCDWKCCPHCNNWFADISTEDDEVEIWGCVQCQSQECGLLFCGRCGQEPHVEVQV
jgi:hypothetical protein